ncbi:conserved hypothetical protein [Leishmania braziliensis MHOM/BR/75/M2904]|uniref:Uncharacterized protein n=2 Tax=Leishmania braziliensis TaxID=5660 RepID=A4H475_LEIBR|nr:conserved hypothetical protein [Leishmania braziliensis MHOM/BR/75/M2904]CAJ2466315.1 unnamed protein product [Leishmania braziliensis]CAM36864.1 conserved hypothetical protein [Leishmania braziliensis MHOM/BR/75/M2904]SYZ62729.1 hypothetical_protein [Leishmania braziliensis MHOM/BR/75/M2904]
MDSATRIPSRVLHLPSPLLQPRGSRWASVQPSPDRASLLLRGRHECQLLAVSSFAQQVPWATALARSSSSGEEDDARHLVAEQWSQRGAARGISAGEGGGRRCLVLPQPHRDLTSSCWLSASFDTLGDEDDEATVSDEVAFGPVVGLGDAASVITIMRPSPLSTAKSPPGTTAKWLQSTIFLEDAEDAVFASRTPLTWHKQHGHHHDGLDVVTALKRPCHSYRALPIAPAWKAVEAILPCSYAPSHPSGGLTDMYVLCQRVDDIYVGSGIAAAGRSARRPCSCVWLSSVQRESAWRVPLAIPPGDEDTLGIGGDGVAASSLAELRHAVRRTPRLFDVRRRLPRLKHASAHESSHPRPAPPPAPAHERASSAETGPMGLVFAAAFRRHVGLYTSATVTPTVFFVLPPRLTDGVGGRTAAATASPSQWCSNWCVTSVVEDSSFAAATPAAALQTSPVGGGSGYSYLVTLMHNQRSRRRSNTHVAPAKVEHRGQSWQSDANSNSSDCDGNCWWLLYDCRNPSLPVWAAEEALVVPPALDEEEVWHDAPVVTEWLASASPPPMSHASLRRSPLCATYVPLAATSTDDASALTGPSACGVCAVLDGGTTRPGGVALDAADKDVVEGEEATAVFSPIVYELSPPRSLRLPAPGAPPTVTTKLPRVRALAYADGVLHYACEVVL